MLGISPPVVSVPAASGPTDPSAEFAANVVAPLDDAATVVDASPSLDESIDFPLADLPVGPGGSEDAVCPVSIVERVSHGGESVGTLVKIDETPRATTPVTGYEIGNVETPRFRAF